MARQSSKPSIVSVIFDGDLYEFDFTDERPLTQFYAGCRMTCQELPIRYVPLEALQEANVKRNRIRHSTRRKHDAPKGPE